MCDARHLVVDSNDDEFWVTCTVRHQHTWGEFWWPEETDGADAPFGTIYRLDDAQAGVERVEKAGI